MKSAFIENPDKWAAKVFSGSTLPDERLNDRLIGYAGCQAVEPAASTSSACNGDMAAQEGAYRMLRNPRMKPQDIEEGPFQYSAELATKRSRVLAVQDTSSVSVRHNPLAEELKSSGSPTGFLVHSALLIDSDNGEVLGLIDQQRWLRKGKIKKGSQVPYEERESFKWEQSARRIKDRLECANSVIHVADRESDIFNLLAYYVYNGERFVIRACTDRRVDAATERLWATLESAPVLGIREVTISQRGGQPAKIPQKPRDARKERIATTEVRACQVSIMPPKDWSGDLMPNGIQINAVLVKEKDPPEGVSPLEWLLLTTEPVDSFEKAQQVIRDYEHRWLIEEFHKCWKTGCNLESRALQSLEAVEQMMVILAPIAVRIMQLQALANNVDEEISCEPILSKAQWQSLWTFFNPEQDIPLKSPSAKWVYYAIARMGGWCDSKRTGRVGWQTIWRGWVKLQLRADGWRACETANPIVC